MGQVIHMSSREIIIFNDSLTPGLSLSLFQNSFFQVNLHIFIGPFAVAQYIMTKQAKSNTLSEISLLLNIAAWRLLATRCIVGPHHDNKNSKIC